MKKTYIEPEITIIALDRDRLLQATFNSGNDENGGGSGDGEDSAAKRGGGIWSDDEED